jgi:hypothetical protein
MTTTSPLGFPTSPFPTMYVNTLGESFVITRPLSASYSGTSYKLISPSSSLYALLHKRVQIAYLARLKTLAAQSQAACEKTTEETSLSDYFPSLVLMDLLTIRRS